MATLDRDIDRLYGLTLEDFTSSRMRLLGDCSYLLAVESDGPWTVRFSP